MNREHKGRRLRKIVDDLELLHLECTTWFDDNVADQLAMCKSFEEIRTTRVACGRQCVN